MSSKQPTAGSSQTPSSGQQPSGQVTQVQAWQGPIPPPSVLAGYDEIVPGLAARIVKMWEGEADHQRTQQAKALDSDIEDRRAGRREARRGQTFGLIIGLTAILSGTYAAVNGAPWVGGFLGTGGVATLVAIFVYGRRHPGEPPQPTN